MGVNQRGLAPLLAALLEGQKNRVGMWRGSLKLQHLQDGGLKLAASVALKQPVQPGDGGLQRVAVLRRPGEQLGARGRGVGQAVGGAGAARPAKTVSWRRTWVCGTV